MGCLFCSFKCILNGARYFTRLSHVGDYMSLSANLDSLSAAPNRRIIAKGIALLLIEDFSSFRSSVKFWCSSHCDILLQVILDVDTSNRIILQRGSKVNTMSEIFLNYFCCTILTCFAYQSTINEIN